MAAALPMCKVVNCGGRRLTKPGMGVTPRTDVAGMVDAPTWQADASALVFSLGGNVKRWTLADAQVDDITPTLNFQRFVPTQRWTLRAGRVVVGLEHKDTARYLWDRDIVIRGNRIEAIVPRSGDSQNRSLMQPITP